MDNKKTISELSVLEVKACLFDLGMQIETLAQQRQVLLNELVERSKIKPTESPVEEIKSE